MFANIKQIFNSKNKDILKRVLFTLAALFVFKVGTSIIVPGVKVNTSGMSFLEVINAMSGGAFTKASIFAIGVTPYITAQIIIQLLSADIVPYLSELAKQGGVGRKKLDQITRITGIALAFIQGYLYSYAYIGNGNPMDYMLYSLILTAGTAFLMWIADQITVKGIGNGMSLIIMAGILTVIPSMFKNLWVELFAKGFIGIVIFAAFVLVFLAIIVGVIYVESAERRIPIQYANKSTSAYGAQSSFLPIKLNSAGVMPVIFASILTTIPATIVALTKNQGAIDFVNKYIVYNTPTGFILYIILILFFGYFYTFMVMNPDEMSKNLNERGGYIPGIRPGEDTSKYISNSMGKLTLVGSIFLVILAAIPIIFSLIFGLSSQVTIGGTGMLIVVGVAIETYKQMESSLVSRSYTAKRKRLR